MEQSEAAATADTSQQQQQSTQEVLENATFVSLFGKEDTTAESQRHAARTQDTLVNAVENAEGHRKQARNVSRIDTTQSDRNEGIRCDCLT